MSFGNLSLQARKVVLIKQTFYIRWLFLEQRETIRILQIYITGNYSESFN